MQYSQYFQSELSALRDLGKEFSEQNPRLAPFLSVEGQDPDVERLLEGFAFLTGRIRQKLDDDLPEFAWSLIKLVWPHFLQSIPSITTVELRPMDILSGCQPLAKGAELKSIPVDGTACIFQTSFDVDVHPMSVKSVEVTESGGVSKIALNLALHQQTNVKDIALDNLNLHLHGAFPKTSLWYYLLRQRLACVELWGTNEGQKVKLGNMPSSAIASAGLASNQRLFSASGQQFSGHRLLFEYFCFPEKFLYLDLEGVGKLIRNTSQYQGDISSIVVEFTLDHILPPSDHPTADNIRLFCSPAVNQFQASARPFLLDQTRAEHRMRVEAPSPDHYEIMTVDRVEGWSPESRQITQYSSLESFCPSHMAGSTQTIEPKTYWSQQRPSINGKGQETYLSFVSVLKSKPNRRLERAGRSQDTLKSETISGQVTCSNRHLPSMLRVGDICSETSSIPEYLNCTNISSVTPSYSPATKMNWIWRLIAHSALNINKLHDLDSLKALISQFDLRGLFDKQQQAATKLKVEGLEALTINASNRLFKGVPVKGNEIELLVNGQNFSGLGDIFLLGEILNEFFAASAAVNSFHRLTVKTIPDGDVMQWKARVGDCQLN
ncbi:type VI secretion system baseplate subunit TssF [Alkalimarinus alittae]|uniref:Type VI secretion system baseplate subunit TssF n=1 Tax=Alkalimarinus alittae TaxID=2961619 RepID=A0ABY6MZ29_9ALTE|nr:type VI secretion system baseplate subunit TssF [Alkalimarinus alittae]UZE95103.1 type VI secretion system baseplate subunit TssF [Alkalimarinus alittae]